MKPEVLAVFNLGDHVTERLARHFTVHRLWTATDPEAMLRDLAPRIQAVFMTNMHGATAAFMDKLPNLRIISSFGAGYERIDIAAAKARGIMVTNVQATNCGCVADSAIGLMIAAQRQIAAADRFVRSGGWLTQRLYDTTPRVYGRRMGIIGLGAIGREIARRAEAFDMEIGYHNRRRRDDVPYYFESSVLKLAEWADVLVAACPLNSETRGIVNRDVLKALGPEGVFVNIARGGVADEKALIEALRNRTIRAAGLDVYENEPDIDPAFFTLENAVLTPHCAGITIDSALDSAEVVIANLKAFFAGRPPITRVA